MQTLCSVNCFIAWPETVSGIEPGTFCLATNASQFNKDGHNVHLKYLDRNYLAAYILNKHVQIV